MESLQKELELLQLFKTNMIDFLDELIQQFEEEGDLMVMRFFLSEQVPVELLMKQFHKFVMPHKELIRTKNEQFFLEHDNIFGSSPKDKVVHFKQLYLKMANEDRDTLWAWFKSFISICDKWHTDHAQ
jgi:hypothetical protein